MTVSGTACPGSLGRGRPALGHSVWDGLPGVTRSETTVGGPRDTDPIPAVSRRLYISGRSWCDMDGNPVWFEGEQFTSSVSLETCARYWNLQWIRARSFQLNEF